MKENSFKKRLEEMKEAEFTEEEFTEEELSDEEMPDEEAPEESEAAEDAENDTAEDAAAAAAEELPKEKKQRVTTSSIVARRAAALQAESQSAVEEEKSAAGAAVEAVTNRPEEKGRKKRKKKLYDYTPENDIRYKGILSYRHLKIMGWLCVAMTVANIFLSIAMKVEPSLTDKYDHLSNVFSFFAEFAIFFFLFANLAVIIDKKSSYKMLFMMYGGLSVLFVILFYLIYHRYLFGIVKSVNDTTGQEIAFADILDGYFVTFNIFLDLLLCTLVVFFLDYKPKKYFVGSKLKIFRCFVLIPISYEVISTLIKYLATVKDLRLHPMVSPFLTTKPVMLFLLFLRMAFYVKNRERKFLKLGKTHEQYEAFLETNANSLQFAKKFALMTLIYGLIDLIIVAIMVAYRMDKLGIVDIYNNLDKESAAEVMSALVMEVKNYGFGGSVMMILFSPFILLFSYTKTYKKILYDIMIPVIGFIVVFIVVLEGIFRVLCLIPSRVDAFLGY